MRRWNKALLAAALSGLILLLTGTVLLMSAPSHFYEKLALFTGGLLISILAMLLQVRAWNRCQNIEEKLQ